LSLRRVHFVMDVYISHCFVLVHFIGKARIPLGSLRHVSARLDTFDVSRRDVTS